MDHLIELLHQHGAALIFATVFLEECGLPVPTLPILVISGAMIAEGTISVFALAAAILSASLVPNLMWFRLGIQYGRRTLGLLCKISLSPDVCVRQTENLFVRWGAGTLVLARFVPGLSLMAPPLAGALGFSWVEFLLYEAVGQTIFSGLAVLLGFLFHRAVGDVLAVLSQFGSIALVAVGVALFLYVGWRYFKRQQQGRLLGIPRISVEELKELMDSGANLSVVDVRSSIAQSLGKIPGAISAQIDQEGSDLAHLAKDKELILYCSCPNEVSAAKLADILIRQGYSHVRPLRGGLDAWVQAGHAVVEKKGRKEA